MKACPKCKRTYADDAFTFCLEDGALLSAPYDPKEEKRERPHQRSEPPPTAVMPRTTDPQLQPTIPSPPPMRTPETKPSTPSIFDGSIAPQKSSVRRYVAISIIALFVLGLALMLFAFAADTKCPELVINCSPGDARTYCHLEERHAQSSVDFNRPISQAISSLRPIFGLQTPPLPKSITGATWSASAGTVDVAEGTQTSIVNTGLAGQRITVEANIQSSVWLCSKTVSTSYVVPASTFPATPAK